MRMDERLQQLLRLMSALAGRSAACVSRGLAGGPPPGVAGVCASVRLCVHDEGSSCYHSFRHVPAARQRVCRAASPAGRRLALPVNARVQLPRAHRGWGVLASVVHAITPPSGFALRSHPPCPAFPRSSKTHVLQVTAAAARW